MEDKPEVEDIKALVEQRERYYDELHKQQKIDDVFYELEFDAGVPKNLGYEQRTPPTARDWVDIGVMHFTLDNPKATVPPRSKSDAGREKDANCEAFYNFWLNNIILDIKEAARKILIRGEIFYKIWMDDTYFGMDTSGMDESEVEELRNKALLHFPLVVDIPDPINVYASPAHNGLFPKDVIEMYQLTVAEAMNMCSRNGWQWDTDKKETDMCKWVSFISADWRCFLIDNEPVLKGEVQPNILRFCPYVHAGAGFGHKNFDGKPEYLYRSILYGNRDMINMESRVLSQIDAINARFAWSRVKVKGEEAEVEALYGKNPLVISPEEVIRETERVSVEILQGESPPPGLFEQLAVISSKAQPPSVLTGRRPPGVYSAQGLEDLIGTAKPKYKDAFKNLEEALNKLMGMGARVIDSVYKEPVAVEDFMGTESHRRIRSISPKDIDGHYECSVKLLAEPPEATDIRRQLGTNLQKAGVISHKSNLRMYQDFTEEEALDEQAQILAERAMQQPGMLEITARDAVKRLGMEIAEEELEEAEGAGRIAGNIPPRREPETVPSGRESVRVRGRGAPGMERSPSPQETMVGSM